MSRASERSDPFSLIPAQEMRYILHKHLHLPVALRTVRGGLSDSGIRRGLRITAWHIKKIRTTIWRLRLWFRGAALPHLHALTSSRPYKRPLRSAILLSVPKLRPYWRVPFRLYRRGLARIRLPAVFHPHLLVLRKAHSVVRSFKPERFWAVDMKSSRFSAREEWEPFTKHGISSWTASSL